MWGWPLVQQLIRANGFTGNMGKAIATPGIVILGAAIGAALPTGSWQEVYGSR